MSRRKGVAQPWWGGDHADVRYRLSVDRGLHQHSLRIIMAQVRVTFGECPHCHQRQRLYDGCCYAARQQQWHAANSTPRRRLRRKSRGRLP